MEVQGKQYVKFLEDFESILHKKGLRTMYKKYKASQDVRQAEFDLYKMGKPKPCKWNKPTDTIEYVLITSQDSGKIQNKAPKGTKKPSGGHTTIKVWNNTCVE